MKPTRLTPPDVRPQDTAAMEAAVARELHALIFAPLVDEIKKVTSQKPLMLNSDESVLRQALRSGQVQYADGVFSGEFNSRISLALRAMGGKLDHRSHVYRVPRANIPSWVKAEATAYNAKTVALNATLRKKLDEIEAGIDSRALALPVAETVARAVGRFSVAAEIMGVSPTITPDSQARLEREYRDNVDLKIKGFGREAVAQLRTEVEKNALTGYRSDKLVRGIGRRFAVTQARAKFIAREETRLFTATFHEQRYKEAGVSEYFWSDSGDERVRDDHHDLNGKRFSFDNPPIVNKATGKRANPGGDYGCRCKPIVILRPS